MRKAELAIGKDTHNSGNGVVAATADATAAEATDARRRAWFYGIIALLALVGLADAIYLTVNHLTGSRVRCGEYAGCSEVLSSSYAVVVGGLPLAALGGAAYFVVFGLSVLAAFGYRSMQMPLLIVVSTMAVVTGWLLYVQAFVLKAFCFYCLLSATVTLLLVTLVLMRRRII